MVHAAQRRAAPWPYANLDVAELKAGGWQPLPVHDVIVKVHQRCNLACDYCYVYEHADQSWRDRPSVMTPELWTTTVASLARHVRRHAMTSLRIILHGGEPLLVGATRLGELAGELRAALPQTCVVEIGMQTNGVLLDAATVEALLRHGIKAGVSVDGTPADHDRHRVLHNGRGTSSAVGRALDLLRKPENRAAYAGLLCTVAPDTDPIATLRATCSRTSRRSSTSCCRTPTGPSGPGGRPARRRRTATGSWPPSTAGTTPREPIRVRLFEDVMSLLLGGAGPLGAARVESGRPGRGRDGRDDRAGRLAEIGVPGRLRDRPAH